MGFCKTVALHKSAALVFFPGEWSHAPGPFGFSVYNRYARASHENYSSQFSLQLAALYTWNKNGGDYAVLYLKYKNWRKTALKKKMYKAIVQSHFKAKLLIENI